MKILISGATGFVGTALCESLQRDGHSVVRLSRRSADARDESSVHWDPASGRFEITELEKLQGIDAAVHLAGESIIGRWTPHKKIEIRESRVRSTQLLSETLAHLPKPPGVFISASAVGYYGYRGSEILREDSSSGKGFLASVCREWEDAADAARAAGIRTVHPRLGIILDKSGGALGKMLLPFRLGLGGPIGSGRQFMSWITRSDTVRALRFAIDNNTIEGPINLTTSQPITNRTFAQTLGVAVKRPAFTPLPTCAVRLAFGKEAADETLLASQRAVPEKLLAHGFVFEHAQLKGALEAIVRG